MEFAINDGDTLETVIDRIAAKVGEKTGGDMEAEEPMVVCAWTGEEVPEGETHTLSNGDVVSQEAWEEDGVVTEDGVECHLDDAVYYDYRDCYYSQAYWDRRAVTAEDGCEYMPEDCQEIEVYARRIAVIPPHADWSDYDLYTCEGCGIAVHGADVRADGGYAYCPDCYTPDEEEDGILPYSADVTKYGCALGSAGKPVHDLRTSRLPLYGVELECEAVHCGRAEAIDYVHSQSVKGNRWAICKSDSSLDDDDGLEIVSVPAAMDVHREVWPSLVTTLQRMGVRSYSEVDNRCGLHVHCNRRAFLNDAHVARFCHLVGAPANRALSELIGQRSSDFARIRDKSGARPKYTWIEYPHFLRTRYLEPGEAHPCGSVASYVCEITDERGRESHLSGERVCVERKPSILGYARGEHGHYDACAPTDKDTIEVRIYKGTLHRLGVIRALEHCDSARVFTETCGNNGATSDGYLRWIAEHRRDYPALSAFLWRKSEEYRRALKGKPSGYVLAIVNYNIETEESSCA